MKRIIINGVAGFIGHQLADYFLSLGHDVLGIDIIPTSTIFSSYPSALRDQIITMRMAKLYQYHTFQYCNPSSVLPIAKKFRPDVILNFAGSSIDNTSLIRQGAAEDLSTLTKMIELASITNVGQLIYASSASLYELGSQKDVAQSEHDKILIPTKQYPYSKWLCEQYAHAITKCAKTFDITGIRIFSAYGPLARMDMVPWLYGHATYVGKNITVHQNCTRDFVHSHDICKILDMLTNITSLPPIINVGSGKSTSMQTLAKLACDRSILDPQTQCNYIDGDGTHTLSDTTLLNTILRANSQLTSDYQFMDFNIGMLDTINQQHILLNHFTE